MTKRRHSHDPAGGRKALAYGVAEGFGPMTNTRHPRKFKLEPLNKKTAPSAANTEDGKQTAAGVVDTNDNKQTPHIS